MKYGIIKVKRAFLYEENGVDVVDEVFFGWSVMWEDEGEWIEVWTHYGYRGWMERNLIEEKSREWMEEREKAGNTYVVTRGFADVMRGARVQARMLETLGRGCFVEKMEETENGYCRVKLANGISGFVPEVALRKRLDSDRFLWKIGREVFCGAGDSGGVVGREVSEEGCGVCEGVSWMPVPVGREGGGWD